MTLLVLLRRATRLLRRLRPYAVGVLIGWLLAFLEGLVGDKVLRLSARGLRHLTAELDPADTAPRLPHVLPAPKEILSE